MLKEKRYKLLVTFYLLLVGIMGWVVDALSFLDSDIIHGLKPDRILKYIMMQSRTFLLSIAAIIFYWCSPWIIKNRDDEVKDIDRKVKDIDDDVKDIDREDTKKSDDE